MFNGVALQSTFWEAQSFPKVYILNPFTRLAFFAVQTCFL